jgi:uncharacterized FAD-dependent dehydrogenase
MYPLLEGPRANVLARRCEVEPWAVVAPNRATGRPKGRRGRAAITMADKMPYLIRNIRLGLDEPEEELLPRVAKRLRVPQRAIRSHAIVRRSLDARKKSVHFTYQLEVALDQPLERQRARLRRLRRANVAWLQPMADVTPRPGTTPLSERPIVIGFGPGGMFAALRLARLGYKPIVLERGREVRRRHRDVLQRFYRERDLDPSSNLLFGEGGAGTYSDGKLYTRISDPLCRFVLETLYHHGADPDILIDARPHIGSDRLPTICMRIRKRIESLGGEIRFECHVSDVRITDGRLRAIQVSGPRDAAGGEWLPCGPTILATGHSARDTIAMLASRGVRIEPKPFQIGVRIEHPQAMVDRWQYGAAAGHARLGPAEYQLVAKGAAGEHGDLFSFCMCPGGMILPTAESPGLIATNGASRANRASPFANSGLVITMDPASLGQGALEALEFQAQWERLAFQATGGSYDLPAQRAADYLRGRSSNGALNTSYPLGGQWTDIRSLIPPQVAAALDHALPMLDTRFPGFAGDEALLAAPETRGSAPIRIVRDNETRQAVETAGLYPVGEGAGYAGGIVSAAVDGIRTADTIIESYAPAD